MINEESFNKILVRIENSKCYNETASHWYFDETLDVGLYYGFLIKFKGQSIASIDKGSTQYNKLWEALHAKKEQIKQNAIKEL